MERNDIKIDWLKLFEDIEGTKNMCLNRISISKEIIPIIFVPGIMGSRLKLKKPGQEQSSDPRIWDPDDNGFMLKKYGKNSITPQMRKMLLVGKSFDPGYAEVDNDNTEHNKMFADPNDPTRAERGWGGIMWSAYGPFITALQNIELPNPLKHCFDIWVHTFGYNWTDSNYNSGEQLALYITKVISDHNQGKYCSGGILSRICNKVILVTHSMGGMVARSACMIYGAQINVHAVIHGVQPATGAATAYWRMKAGFERPGFSGPNKDWWDWFKSPKKMASRQALDTVGAWVLGTDGEEVTSLLCNIPGGLELLPTPDYVDNEGNTAWLTYESQYGKIKLPRSDVYSEIYLEQEKAYRLVESRWLNPGNIKIDDDARSPWDSYVKSLKKARRFHEQLQTQFHAQSYQFYVSCLDSSDKIVLKRSDYMAEMVPTNRGTYRVFVDKNDKPTQDVYSTVAQIRLEDPNGKGDGTVPRSSGSALKLPENMSREILKTDSESAFSMGHQDIYKFRKAQVFTFDCIYNSLYKIVNKETGKQYSIFETKAAME